MTMKIGCGPSRVERVKELNTLAQRSYILIILKMNQLS